MDAMRRAGAIVARILKGAHPSSIPVDRATRYSLVVNRRSAESIGLSLPASILVAADQVLT